MKQYFMGFFSAFCLLISLYFFVEANHNNVGIILDSFHTLSKGINLDTITSIPKEKIFIVQIDKKSVFLLGKILYLLFWHPWFVSYY